MRGKLRAFAKELEALTESVFGEECAAFNSHVVGGKTTQGQA